MLVASRIKRLTAAPDGFEAAAEALEKPATALGYVRAETAEAAGETASQGDENDIADLFGSSKNW